MTTLKENSALDELVEELDSEFGDIAGRLVTLNDVKSVLDGLRVNMDNVKEEELRFRFSEFQRSVRLIDDLFHYTMESLNSGFEDAQDTKDVLFQKLIREGL